jgi:hypothetical protein
MSDAGMGLTLLGLVTVAIAWLANRRVYRGGWAVVAMALASAFMFQLLAALHQGYVDPFALVGFVVSLLVTLPLSWAVGRLAGRVRTGHWGSDT